MGGGVNCLKLKNGIIMNKKEKLMTGIKAYQISAPFLDKLDSYYVKVEHSFSDKKWKKLSSTKLTMDIKGISENISELDKIAEKNEPFIIGIGSDFFNAFIGNLSGLKISKNSNHVSAVLEIYCFYLDPKLWPASGK